MLLPPPLPSGAEHEASLSLMTARVSLIDCSHGSNSSDESAARIVLKWEYANLRHTS